MLVTPKGELIASSTGLVGSTEQGRSARPDHEYKRKAREEDDGNERRALPITPFAPAFINIQLKYSAKRNRGWGQDGWISVKVHLTRSGNQLELRIPFVLSARCFR